MNHILDKLTKAQQYALSIRPKIGGFPYLAEALRQAGVTKNIWFLPSCQAIYVMDEGSSVVQQGAPLVNGLHLIPKFDQEALVKCLRADQAGQSTFLQFLNSAWQAGVTGYEVDFIERKVTYYNAQGGSYLESYPSVEIKNLS